MATYMLFIREEAVRDAGAMATYSAMNRSQPRHPDLTPLVAYGAQEVLEGEGPDGIVILRFPDAAAARSWYDSPDYQAASEFRRKGANYRVVMVEGL